MRYNRLICFVVFGSCGFFVQPSAVIAQQKPPSVAESAQKAVEAANRAEAAVKALQLKLQEATQKVVIFGNPVRCDLTWGDSLGANVSIAACPSGYKLSGGGCDMTCLSMTHQRSIPYPPDSTANSWKCQHAPQPGPMLSADRDNKDEIGRPSPRTFAAVAVCQKMP
jgi:hypothetical protein